MRYFEIVRAECLVDFKWYKKLYGDRVYLIDHYYYPKDSQIMKYMLNSLEEQSMTLRKEIKTIIGDINAGNYEIGDMALSDMVVDDRSIVVAVDDVCSLIKERLESLPEQLSEGDTGWLCVDKQWIDNLIKELS